MKKPPEISVSEADWQQTPSPVQSLVLTLWERVQQLAAEVAMLREQVGQNSRNSSRPPSSDPPSVDKPKAKRSSSGRSAGGQPKHEGHGRKLRPVEEVDEVVPVKPGVCRQCGATLSGEDVHPQRHQVIELPPVQPLVTEYQRHTLPCGVCGTLTEASLPEGVPSGAFGPRLQALVGLLSGSYRLSKRKIQGLLSDCFGVELALGSVCPLEQATSEAIAAPVDEAQAYVRAQAAVNLDETGWREGNRKAWLWTAVTGWVSVFVIRFSRGSKVVRELLGQAYEGIVGSDRWTAYNFLSPKRRQVCWAHLKREFEAFRDRGGESAPIGEGLLAGVEQMFTWWHRVRDGTLQRSTFQQYMGPLKGRIGELLRQGAACAHANTAATCRELLKVEPALWTFVRVEGVEPTNNMAEQALRHGVLWRKSSFGTQSAAGSRRVERMMTVVASLRQQGRPVWDYLTAACEAALRGEAAPSLLPKEAAHAAVSQST